MLRTNPECIIAQNRIWRKWTKQSRDVTFLSSVHQVLIHTPNRCISKDTKGEGERSRKFLMGIICLFYFFKLGLDLLTLLIL